MKKDLVRYNNKIKPRKIDKTQKVESREMKRRWQGKIYPKYKRLAKNHSKNVQTQAHEWLKIQKHKKKVKKLNQPQKKFDHHYLKKHLQRKRHKDKQQKVKVIKTFLSRQNRSYSLRREHNLKKRSKPHTRLCNSKKTKPKVRKENRSWSPKHTKKIHRGMDLYQKWQK